MKVAVSAIGKGLDSQVDVRFGRCPYFVIVELENNEIKGSEDVENTATSQMGGAGMTAAELAANKGANVIITGNIGPKAFQVFSQLELDVYQCTGTVREAIEKFAKGELRKVSGPTGPMGIGMPAGNPGSGQQMGQGKVRGTSKGRIKE